MRVERVVPGRRVPGRLAGAVLTRDLEVAGRRWSKGRRLTDEDLAVLGTADAGPAVTLLIPEPGELHEDEAAIRLAKAIAGPNLEVRGPNQSRLDLVAATPGVVNVAVAELERLNRLDPLEVFLTRAEIRVWSVLGGVGTLSAALALLTPISRWVWPGWVYMLLPILMPWFGARAGRTARRLRAERSAGSPT